jgi:hypothetical protein
VLDPERTLAIVCGAKKWPKLANFESAEAFANSATLIRHYLTGKKGLGLSRERILWLFGKPDAVAQFQRITDFLHLQFEALGSPRGRGVLILFFYVGHGAFFGTDRTYCLLVQDTYAPLEEITSLRVPLLARLFRLEAAESSRIFFLDCCFAGEAVKLFQGELDQVVSAKTHEVVEQAPTDRGVALLCASSARNPASMESPTSYTFFGHELMQVLTKGDSNISGALTLRQLCDLVRCGLRSTGGDDAPNPEVHVPDQVGGDLAAIPLFPNPAWHETYFRRAKLREEHVFVSYASQDSWAAQAIAGELRKRFQLVFEFKDGGASLPAGTSWMDELYSRLHDSRIGIPVLSSSYVKFETCMREAQLMMIRADQDAMEVIPLNVDGVKAPVFMQTLQFRPIDRSTDIVQLVNDIIAQYDSTTKARR